MAKRRRQASSRISWLDKKASNGIGWFFVHMPPGDRKSGIPHSVEIPAPVKGTMTEAFSISCRRRVIACGKIGGNHLCIVTAFYQ